MNLNKNSKLVGAHASLSPSSYHWINYDEDKVRTWYFQKQQASRGDKLHALAAQLIEMGIRLPDLETTMSMYVNDAIGYLMTPEFPVFYSIDCFGTCDAIGIRMEKDRWVLRISDLKTGILPADMKQLLIYCAIFFHEYKTLYKPHEVDVVLRIYQNDTIVEHIPEIPEILWYMDRVKTVAGQVAYLREED